jgi:hypothetical protein
MGNPTKLIPDTQLILDAPLLKVPLELIRRNFKSAQRTIDKETKAITASLNEAAQKAQIGVASADETIASIDLMIKRMSTLKRKVCCQKLGVILMLCSLKISKQKRSCGFIDPKYGLDTHPVYLNVTLWKISNLRSGVNRGWIDYLWTTCSVRG